MIDATNADTEEHTGRSRNAAPCSGACKMSRKGSDRYLTCDDHRRDIPNDRCSDGVEGGDGCALCGLLDMDGMTAGASRG